MIRTLIHRFRKAVHKLIGTRHEVDVSAQLAALTREMEVLRVALNSGSSFETSVLPNTNVLEALLRLSDRLAILESNLNWRLYGMPARVCNIKLEQARILAGSGDVEGSIAAFGSLHAPFPADALAAWAKRAPGRGAALVFPGPGYAEAKCVRELWRGAAPLYVIADDTDWLQGDVPAELKGDPGLKVLEVSPMSAAALFAGDGYGQAWLSSLLERVTPIQALVILRRARAALGPEGRCAGYFLDYQSADAGLYWTDPRRLRPMTKAFVDQIARLAGFKDVAFAAVPGRPGAMLYDLA